MKKWLLLAAAALLGACCNRTTEALQAQPAKDVFAKGSLLENNPNFTGEAWLEMFVTAADSMDCTVGNVTFAPGVRNPGMHIRAARSCSAHPARGFIRNETKQSGNCAPVTW